MRTIREIPLERARQLFAYDPGTGALSRKATGKQVGYKYTNGYLQYPIDGRVYGVHRIAWALHYGENPPGLLDHINCNPSDNRISNLRIADESENNRNKLISKRNKSGVKHVFLVKWNKAVKWRVAVGLNKGYQIEHFYCLGHAVKRARELRNEMHGAFANNGYQPVGAL